MLHVFDLNHWLLYYIQCFHFSAVVVTSFHFVFFLWSNFTPIELLVKELGESRNEVARLASEMNQLLEDIGACWSSWFDWLQ